ncbi:MAG TPA: SMC-Scp complex subunit ScpB [Dissulfurispiraceae bacterium]|nr:SMC-Scp complex subunit ScpB [Dissulfurispiraceae bacterium]
MENSETIGASEPDDANNTTVEQNKNKPIIEALLFAAGEPLTAGAIAKATSLNEHDIKEIMRELIADYRDRNSGIVIAEIADGYEMVTAPEHAAWIRRLKNISVSNKLSQPALETLSIMAYKQPLTKVEVDQLRGVNSDAAVKSLLDKHLIKIIGKKESPGRPFLYATTNEFLQYFGLKNLTELPAIHDFFNTEAA